MENPDEVLRAVSSDTGVPVEDIISSGRQAQFVQARRVAAVAFRLLGFSSPQTGEILGNRDHTTVLHLLKTAQADDIEQAEECLTLLERHVFSVRWETLREGVRWFALNPRTGAEIKLPVETGLALSAALSLSGVDA